MQDDLGPVPWKYVEESEEEELKMEEIGMEAKQGSPKPLTEEERGSCSLRCELSLCDLILIGRICDSERPSEVLRG
jgi:hypothetical protein